MKFKDILNEKNNKPKDTQKGERVIPKDEVMKMFDEIYKKHKKVFDYLKDK